MAWRWLLILLLAAAPAWAQEGGSAFPPDAGGGGATYDGGSVTNPFLAPSGCATPGFSFTGDPDTGVCQETLDANRAILAVGGARAADFQTAPSGSGTGRHRFYGFYTDGSNYESLDITQLVGAGYYQIAPVSVGTGNDDINLRLAGTALGGPGSAFVESASPFRTTSGYTIEAAGGYRGYQSCAVPLYSFNGNTDDGFCLGTETGWAVDTVAMAMGGNEIAQIYTASGGEWFFEVKNPLVSPQRMFRVRGDVDMTRIHYYAPGEPAYTYDITMLPGSNIHTYTILPLPDDVTPVTFALAGGTGGPPAFRWAEDLDNGSNYVNVQAPNALSANQSIEWPDASGTVALTGTKVTQASTVTTSAVAAAPVGTDLSFTPAASTRYEVHGVLLVESNNASYGIGVQFNFPTADAVNGGCRLTAAIDLNSHNWYTIAINDNLTNRQIATPTTPDVDIYQPFFIDCYFEVTTNPSGDFDLDFYGENALGSYKLYAGSYIEYKEF